MSYRALAAGRLGIKNEGLLAAPLFLDAKLLEFGGAGLLPLASLLHHLVRRRRRFRSGPEGRRGRWCRRRGGGCGLSPCGPARHGHSPDQERAQYHQLQARLHLLHCFLLNLAVSSRASLTLAWEVLVDRPRGGSQAW